MKMYILLWPYMIYNPLYMIVPPLAVKSMTKKTYIPKDTYKKIETYKRNVVVHNVRSGLKGR